MGQVSIDRFEGELAVLATEAGDEVILPRAMLPGGVKAGDILSMSVEKDADATRRVSTKTRKVRDKLKGKDPGGDIKL